MQDFDCLWDEFYDKLLHYIKSKVANTHDAEDILQTVFVKIYKSIEQLEDQTSIKPWIYRIAKNTIIDFYKKKKDVLVAPETFDMMEDETEVMDTMNEEIAQCIGKMVFTLPEKYQEVYTMYEHKAMKHKEIAETLDISVSTSKVRLNRAKVMFKEKLLGCCEFEVDKYGNVLDYQSRSGCDPCDRDC